MRLLLKTLLELSKRKRNEGFTLIELLVVIIIISILAAIALPTFLAQRNRAVESEPRQYLPAINKAQEAEFAKDGEFGEIGELEVGLTLNNNDCSQNYCYLSTVGTSGGFAEVVTTATPVNGDSGLIGMAGRVFITLNDEREPVIGSLFCESDTAVPPALSGVGTCPVN